MGKLPIIKDRDLIRALKRLGFAEARQHGTSHLILKHPDGRLASVSIHPGRDIPRGTLQGLLRDIEIRVDDFVRALNE
jgi:predicted RNA binding protein YcfA (HicA-like mRNA interferase family)